MFNKLGLMLAGLLTATMLLAACAPDVTPTVKLVTPTLPTATAGALPDGSASQVRSLIKAGLVTDTGGVADGAFNQLAWEGIQKAAKDMGFQSKYIEFKQTSDYETNIEALVSEGYNVIITVGAQMGEATALKAKQYPNIKFAIVDNAYADGGLSNVTSLMFAEDQLGFLAGVLAGGMSKSGFVCSISSIAPPASDHYVISFRAGAVWQGGENIRGMNNYINIQTTNQDMPNFTDATQGKETALKLIGAGCDVVFGVAADGALLAAKESNLPAIGVDVDEYNTYPEAKEALISSAQKKVDVAVYNYLTAVADGSVKAGIRTGTLQNGEVGLAPFHDWDSKIPDELKAQIQKASEGISDGSIKVDGGR